MRRNTRGVRQSGIGVWSGPSSAPACHRPAGVVKGCGLVLLLVPAARVVDGLIADQGEGDAVGSVGHGAGDHAALLAPGPQAGTVDLCGGVVEPQAHAEVDQSAAELDAALPADRPVASLS